MATNEQPQAQAAWTPERVKQWFDQRSRSSADDYQRVTPWHRAAAVLATFDPWTLHVPGMAAPQGDELARLVADVAIASDGNTTRSSLKPDFRRLALASFADAATLRDALNWNTRDPTDPLQRALDGYILGHAAAVEHQDESDLGAAALVVAWLSATPFARDLSLPDPDHLRRRLDFLRLVGPLRAMVGSHFRGRQDELQTMTSFLLSAGDGEFAPKPLMLTGYGGSGKTTLIAKVLLDYTDGRLNGSPGPFVFIDFDRPSLRPQEAATLLLEAARQLTAQSPRGNPAAESIIVAVENSLQTQRPYEADEHLSIGQLLTGNFGAVMLNQLDDALDLDEWRDRTLLVVLDTFEEVQYHSQKVVEHVWSFLSALRERVPRVRIIVSGRAPVQIEGHMSPFSVEVSVDELDSDAAVSLLDRYGIPPETARFIHDHVRGNPLALRLAAELVRLEKSDGTFANFISEEFARKIDEELAQAILFRRILGHVKAWDVRKLAHPGLTLRRISPALILEVLAGPCGIDVPDIGRAEALYKELSRETSVVLQESGVLRHRPELRRQMIGLLRARNPRQVDEIHHAAIAYYERFDDDVSRAEELPSCRPR